MPQLRLALAQVDPTVGDLDGNAEIVLRCAHEAAARGAHVLVAPEMVLTGYPVEDLALRRSFVEASGAALDRLAARLLDEGLGQLVVVVGHLDRAERDAQRAGRPAGSPQNAASYLHGGRSVARYAKHHLPNYGVFDEYRYFVPGAALPVVQVHGVDVATVICEDLWQDGGPVSVVREAGAGLLLVVNASPYERGKDDQRLELVRRRVAEAGCVLAYVNTVGAQDELVFDGESVVVAPDGRLLARAPQFEPALLVVDLDLPAAGSAEGRSESLCTSDGVEIRIDTVPLLPDPLPPYEPVEAALAQPLDDLAEVYGALVTGLRDYVRKNGFATVALGLSGGIDSAMVATIAADALGADAVHVVGLPSKYSSEGSVADAEELARRQGLHWEVVPIGPVVAAYEQVLEATGGVDGLAEENLQSRVRGTALMALSNQHGHLILTCGNKSELSVGYSTLYGDTAGGFAPIKDVPKTLLYELARWRNAQASGRPGPVPQAIIDKEPSAELAPGQLDSDRLPDYGTLDALLDDYVVGDLGGAELVEAGHDPELVERVLRLVDLAEYKRRQNPPGSKITPRAFGRDRRQPITNRWRERTPGSTSPAGPGSPHGTGRPHAEHGAAGEPAGDPRD